jgi:hypothetical protein
VPTANGVRMKQSVMLMAGILALALPLTAGAKQVRRAAPLISLTAPLPEDRAAEIRLMQFIKALHLNERQKAAGMLSSRVPRQERDALVKSLWLRRPPATRTRLSRSTEIAQILFLPDLQIRTEKLFKDGRTLIVLPRKNRKKGVTGAIRVPMRREQGRWWVELRPEIPLRGR